jgi:8-oxo-dGTP pyrophosphatase MutT (NUDIX family)
MKQVAKLIICDRDNKYLLLYRSNHPSFPYDPDLPGGTVEDNEEPSHAVIRELSEETGISLGAAALEKLYESASYNNGYVYHLYRTQLNNHPSISISWEHSRYEWLSLDTFTARIYTALDRYMNMAHDYLSQNSSRSLG